jgi:hypothetical protein
MDFSGCSFKSTSIGSFPWLVNSRLHESARRSPEELNLISLLKPCRRGDPLTSRPAGCSTI